MNLKYDDIKSHPAEKIQKNNHYERVFCRGSMVVHQDLGFNKY